MLFHFGFASNPGDRKKHLKTPCAQLGGDSKGMSNKVKTFAQVRTQKTSSFRTVDHVVQEQAIAVATETAATYQLYVENPQQFSFPDAIFVNDQVGTILDMDSQTCRSTCGRSWRCYAGAKAVPFWLEDSLPETRIIGCNFGNLTFSQTLDARRKCVKFLTQSHTCTPCKTALILMFGNWKESLTAQKPSLHQALMVLHLRSWSNCQWHSWKSLWKWYLGCQPFLKGWCSPKPYHSLKFMITHYPAKVDLLRYFPAFTGFGQKLQVDPFWDILRVICHMKLQDYCQVVVHFKRLFTNNFFWRKPDWTCNP